MCGCTLHLGSPHKNSDLGRCSTRQPTVYSYTTSHRSPYIRVDSPTLFYHHHHDHYHPDSHHSISIRVDSPTQFHFHQHHVHYHPDSHQKQPHCTTKHAISSNSCRGHMILNNSYIC